MADELVLWGTPPWGGPPIKITGGPLLVAGVATLTREMLTRSAQGWTDLEIRPAGRTGS